MQSQRFIGSSLAILVLVATTGSVQRSAAADAELRTWTSQDGKHTTEATYVEFKAGKVRLRKADGKSVEVPMGHLGDEDQAYVRKIAPDDPASVQALQEEKVEFERDQENRVTGASFPRSSRINRRHVEHLSGLPNLQRLTLIQVRLGTGVPEAFENLTGLKQLDLTASAIGNPEVKQITILKNLEVLDLSDNQITNRALASLKDLPKLSELRLANTRIADDGIANLEALKQLKKLNLSNTRVSPQGVLRLRKALPNTNMEGSGVSRR
jgi:hypothetical protein